jgi:hypothetical protein
MKPTIYPIENLPAGYTGRIEVTDIPAERDARDVAIGAAALIGAGLLALPDLLRWNPLGIAIGAAVLLYVCTGMMRLRIYTRGDVCAFRAIVEPEKQPEPAQEDGDFDLILLDPLPDAVGDNGHAGEARTGTE